MLIKGTSLELSTLNGPAIGEPPEAATSSWSGSQAAEARPRLGELGKETALPMAPEGVLNDPNRVFYFKKMVCPPFLQHIISGWQF